MKNSADIIDFLKAKLDLKTDLQVSLLLEINSQRISDYRCGRRPISKELAERIATITGAEPAVLLAITEAERSTNEKTRESWHRMIAGATAKAAFAILTLPALITQSEPAEAAARLVQYILC